ncbi:hypothetical protein [Lysinibacillus sp. NPDC056232]|uniref:hypothetical protein n=1 Tax=Lysinibacillus sp. NPDC056232 TaxID=3345756 RepID=UPI0035DC94A9
MLRVVYKNDNEALKWYSSSTSRNKALVYNAKMGGILVPIAKRYGFEIDRKFLKLP